MVVKVSSGGQTFIIGVLGKDLIVNYYRFTMRLLSHIGAIASAGRVWFTGVKPITSVTTASRLCSSASSYPCPPVSLSRPQLDWDLLSDPNNLEKIRENIKLRKSSACIDKVMELYKEIYLNTDIHDMKSDIARDAINDNLLAAGLAVPNMSADRVMQMGDNPTLVYEKPFTNPEFKVRKFEDIARILSGARLSNMTLLSGERTYYLTGIMAELEQALIQWTVDQLVQVGFSLVSVPDLLHPSIISRCGMAVEGDRTQVYQLDPYYGQVALSGTAEMALGGFLAGKTLTSMELPSKMCAVSRCYRAETGRLGEEKGMYRVHQFTKVEMFCVTTGELEESRSALAMVHQLERDLFTKLGLSYRVLDMCADELGDPASEKFDIEAWMPGREMWGEISSCSNCTDYQARRLGVKAEDGTFCHTVNGTACAVPRMLIAICEQMQTENGSVVIPEVLRGYMRDRELMEPKQRKKRPNFLFVTSAKFFNKSKP